MEEARTLLNLKSPSESYADFLNLDPEPSAPPANLKDLFGVADPSRLCFFDSPATALLAALASHFQQNSSASFAYDGPQNSAIEKLLKDRFPSIAILRLGNDPEIMVNQSYPAGTFFLLHSPNPLDSSSWTQTILARVSKHFLEDATAYALIDESLSSLFWDGADDIGTLRHAEAPRVGCLISAAPWTQNRKTLTLLNRAPGCPASTLKWDDALFHDWNLLLQLWNRDFHRGAQHLRLRTALLRTTRTLTEELREEIGSRALACPLWPKAGHAVLFRINKISEIEAERQFRQKALSCFVEYDRTQSTCEFSLIVPTNSKDTRDAAARIKEILRDAVRFE